MGERYLGYMAAWVVADILAWFARFGVSTPGRYVYPFLAVHAASLMGLFLWKNGHRVSVGDLIAVAFVGTLACLGVSFWSQAEMSRLWLVLQLLFGIGALLAAHQVLSWIPERR
jgi:TctA family transporter